MLSQYLGMTTMDWIGERVKQRDKRDKTFRLRFDRCKKKLTMLATHDEVRTMSITTL